MKTKNLLTVKHLAVIGLMLCLSMLLFGTQQVLADEPEFETTEIVPEEVKLKNDVQPKLLSKKELMAQSCDCYIFLSDNFTTCNTPNISMTYGPSNNKAVVKVNLDPSAGYSKVAFDTYFDGSPSGWSVNIGDSRTNNGYSGDGGTQSNDAEMQILNNRVSVYGSDYTPISSVKTILDSFSSNFASVNQMVTFEASNNRFIWDGGNLVGGQVQANYLYALDGRADNEGPINYDIYAGFNRTIGSSSRYGSGVGFVCVKRLP